MMTTTALEEKPIFVNCAWIQKIRVSLVFCGVGVLSMDLVVAGAVFWMGGVFEEVSITMVLREDTILVWASLGSQ